MTVKDAAAIVGIGRTEYFPRGGSLPSTLIDLAGQAILAALDDAGLTADDVDGFAYFSSGFDTAVLAQTLGVPEVRFTAMLTGGGGGAAGSVGLAASAIAARDAEVVVSVMAIQQATLRYGQAYGPGGPGGAGRFAAARTPDQDFNIPSGLIAPGQMFAILAHRHMHLYGTGRQHFAEVAISQRHNASKRETAQRKDPITLDDYFAARMISDPLCLLDYCQESDGAVAVVTTSAERARHLRHRPVYVMAAEHGGSGRWGQAISWMNMPDEYFASSGHRTIAKRLFGSVGITPTDVDVAELYDHFTPMVLMQLEDYGFCPIGESGPFVESGAIRYGSGSMPVNTHGGNLSEAYIMGLTHVYEAVEQLRGTAINQVDGAEIALVTGGPAQLPVSAILLHN